MTLSELLEGKFRGDIRFRGAAYLKAERVAITRVTSDHVFGVVRDGVEYQTQLSREDGSLRMFCNCAKPGQTEVACKHLWGTILAVDEGNYLTGSIKPGYIPPFATDTDVLSLEEEDWDDAPSQVLTIPRLTRREPAVQVQPRLREWEAQLRDLRKAMEAEDPATAATGRDREIFYEIDVEQSRDAGQLVIQTSQRQRRSNGQWGKLKPLKLRPGKFDEVDDDEDRRILAHLAGGTPDRSNWFAQQTELQASIFRYRVPHDLCELILPAMCATGRIRYLGDEERVTETLAWDDGPAWELCLGVVQDEPEAIWKLEGHLRRGEERLPLQKTVLLVPGGLALTRTHIARLNDFGAFAWVNLLARGEALEVPNGEEHELVERLLDMPALPRLELPPELQLEEVRAEPVPQLVVHTPGKNRWQQDRLKAEVVFDYLGVPIRGSSAQWSIVQRHLGRCLLRDRNAEEQAWTQLQECGFRRLLDQRRGRHDVELPARELGPAVRKLITLGWQVRADGKQVHQPGELRFQVRSGIDWFELRAEVNFEGRHVSFPELLSAIARGDTTIRLDDGSLGIIPEEWLRQYGVLAGLGAAEEDHLRFQANQVGLLDALLAAQEGVDYDEKFTEICQQLATFGGIEAAGEPKDFHGELRGYQREGLGWLKFLETFRFGGCLADDMGLGKTIQMLALLEERRQTRREKRPSLVVVPKSLLFNWQQEAERFTPKLKVLEYSGIDRARLRDGFTKHDLILTTYGTLRRDVLVLKEIEFDYVILDEAQAIKNAGSQVAKATRLLKANHRIALSGTPIENHLGDLCSIFEFLNPGMLGRSSVFKLHAADPEDRDTRRILAQGLRPFILRRTKQSVASELPDKIEQTIHCRMSAEQERLYTELRDHYRGSLMGMVEEQGLAKARFHVLEALLRLRQAACHPALLQKANEEESSAKLDVLIPHLEELLDEGHKTLVFSQFTSMLAIVRKHLEQRNIVYEYLDGQTRDRKARVERFQTDPHCGVFLISLKAGGLGLNLTAADYVFLLDPWWNPAVEVQAIDRAHRVGQTRQVFAYRLICQNTVEEKIAELQRKKRDLADAILEQDNATLRDLTTEDLKMLLS